MDDDSRYSEFVFLGSKRYAGRGSIDKKLHITVAGVPKKGAECLKDDLKNFTKNFIFDGTITGMQKIVDKKGRTTLTFNVMGIGINAQIEIYMTPGTNRASATIYPNFNSNTIWIDGDIVPYENSGVFEGASL